MLTKSGQKKEETMGFTDKYASGSEDKLLLRRINDLKNKSEREYCVMYSAFLTPAEQSLIMRVDEFFGCISFDGGTEEAERRLCRIRTDEYQPDDGAPIALLSVAVTDTSAEISHRDVLGSLMGLGIRRDMIGDIFAAGNTALFFCHQSVSEYVIINLTKIGRYKANVQSGSADMLPQPEMKKSTVNVSSMRLDSLCGEGFGMSRTKAQELIRRGLVSVNWQPCDNVSRELCEGDRLSARGYGKLKIGSVTGTSKKGRLFVEIYRFTS